MDIRTIEIEVNGEPARLPVAGMFLRKYVEMRADYYTATLIVPHVGMFDVNTWSSRKRAIEDLEHYRRLWDEAAGDSTGRK